MIKEDHCLAVVGTGSMRKEERRKGGKGSSFLLSCLSYPKQYCNVCTYRIHCTVQCTVYCSEYNISLWYTVAYSILRTGLFRIFSQKRWAFANNIRPVRQYPESIQHMREYKWSTNLWLLLLTICRAGIFKQSMRARYRGGIGFRTGPPGYIGWRNSFLGIDSRTP